VHVPVLLERSLEWLRIRADGIYVDCTAGAGGHSEAIAARLTTGRLIALDRDEEAAAAARARLRRYPQAEVVHGNYGELGSILGALAIVAVDGVLLDAGCSSMQLDLAPRGFSFQEEGPLDMRMDRSQGRTAAEFLRDLSAPELARLLKLYGDVGPARRIAQSILARRDRGRLETTQDLREAVHEALPFVEGMPEETRTVFQAIRMAVNEELRWLEQGLLEAIAALKPQARLVAIAFHSGEDRVVKQVLRTAARPRRELAPDGRVVRTTPALLKVLTPKPERPSAAELAANPRAQSARLRAAERLCA
jgi:16S rRNA (cytosine1402-N4)-methyltransferase